MASPWVKTLRAFLHDDTKAFIIMEIGRGKVLARLDSKFHRNPQNILPADFRLTATDYF
jgi:hypothetical protein